MVPFWSFIPAFLIIHCPELSTNYTARLRQRQKENPHENDLTHHRGIRLKNQAT